MPDAGYVLRRLLQMMPTFAFILVVTFVLVRLLPGDPLSVQFWWIVRTAAQLRGFPVGGYGDGWGDRSYHLFLPALTLGVSLAAVLMRNLRSAIIDVLGAEYVDFARAKGLAPRVVLAHHVLRNALISTLALLGPMVGTLLGGAVITEAVFAIPGVGRLMIDSIYGRDYPVIQGLSLALAVVVSLVFLLTDLVQAALDPRLGG